VSAGVVLKIDNSADRNSWSIVFHAFGITEIYELPGLGRPLEGSIKLERLADLQNYHAADLVVLAARDGDFVQGDTALLEFEHPEEAIYIFGGTMTRLSQSDLDGGAPAAFVYITAGDLFPAQAGAIVLWDRHAKRALS